VAEQLLTLQEAAERLGVREVSVRSAVLRGRLPAKVKEGRKVVSVTDLEHYRETTRIGRPKSAKGAKKQDSHGSPWAEGEQAA
jgi:hypothetical protein